MGRGGRPRAPSRRLHSARRPSKETSFAPLASAGLGLDVCRAKAHGNEGNRGVMNNAMEHARMIYAEGH